MCRGGLVSLLRELVGFVAAATTCFHYAAKVSKETRLEKGDLRRRKERAAVTPLSSCVFVFYSNFQNYWQ